ncbi:MAG: ribose-phosphate pyrophosphokinase [Armatimonadetes bacterium]|nr:ribose-phosphate pyrophosphokinase [Armatimonadota bacterium]
MRQTLRILAGSSNPLLAEAIARRLGVPVSRMLLSRFSDGEVRVKIEESLRGMDAFVVQSTCSPVNEHVMELLIILDALRRASARRITCVIPYYGYARQDKKVKPREPVTARLVADLLQYAGANRILAVDLHAEQIQGFFNIPVDHLYARTLIADHLIQQGFHDQDVVVVSPDVGGVPRATALAEQLEAQLAIVAKRRPEPNKSEVLTVIGEVRGRTCVMIDDIIDTGGSIAAGAEALKRMGAEKVLACCTHAVLSGNAVDRLAVSPLEQVIVTDTIALPPEKRSPKINVLSVAPLLAEAIDRIHRDASVSELFQPYL